jgi:anti-sigma regulatory factor (Ser/Thr protein kinase)
MADRLHPDEGVWRQARESGYQVCVTLFAPNGEASSSPEGFVHQALIYGSEQELVDTALRYVKDGVGAGEPVLIRVRAANAKALREALGSDSQAVDLLPAEGWYETPIRTRRRLLAWAGEQSKGHRVRLLVEPLWPLDSAAGIREWARHEAILNVAFAGSPATFVCPYDAGSLPASIIEHATSTHPEIRGAGGVAGSERFVDPRAYCRRLDRDVSPHSGSPTAELRFGLRELEWVRGLVRRTARRAGLTEMAVYDLVAAVNEIATNALVHGKEPASMRVWDRAGELVFEVSDSGAGFSDPLAGQFKPDLSREGGLGMWIARSLVDAIEVRPGRSGTVVGIHASVSAS